MTPKEEIRRILSEGEKTGLELRRSSSGLRRGTMYIHLFDMEEAGLIRVRDDVHGRFLYSLTEAAIRSPSNTETPT